MRSSRTRCSTLLCVLISVALIALPSLSFAQGSIASEEEIQSLDDEGTTVVESESLGTLEDFRWAPTGIGRLLDLALLRPMAIMLTGLSTVTYSLVVLPTFITGDSEYRDELFNGMVWEPVRYAILRPPFSPADHFELMDEQREAEEALAQEAMQNARREADEAREAAAAKAAEKAAEAAAAEAATTAEEAASDVDFDKAEAGEAPPQ